MTFGNLLGSFSALIALAGVVLVYRAAPWRTRTPALWRVAPYLRDVDSPNAEAVRVPVHVQWDRRLGLARAVELLEEKFGHSDELRQRLERLAEPLPLARYRMEQVLYAVIGGALGAAVASAGVARGSFSPVVGVLLVGWFLFVGAWLRGQQLKADVAARQRRIDQEFPVIAELVALSIAAGEGVVGAMERVGRTCHGELADEFEQVAARLKLGEALVDVLRQWRDRVPDSALSRFLDALVTAIERGTPLVEVVRSQAADAREDHRRSLMEQGGRREVIMLVPVVFLVLPITVLFVLYPGLIALQLGTSP